MSVRRGKASFFSGCDSHLVAVAPASSNRSGSGGNDTAEAFDAKGRVRRPREQAGHNTRERRAGLEKIDAGADPADIGGRPPWSLTGEQLDPCDDPAGVVAMACLHRENERNTGDPRRWLREPTGRPRGTGRAAWGVGEAHSTVEAG